jgi:pyridoxine 5'-phosphate synthase PdxJ
MTAHLHEDTRAHRHADLIAHLDFVRRVRELEELAASEGIKLPMPATWISTLEALGYVVDLHTGAWTDAEDVRPAPTEAAYLLILEGAQHE